MAYVPPHLRRTGAQSENPPTATPNTLHRNLTLGEIENHFWPAKDQAERVRNHVIHGGVRSTLHDSAETPGELSFVILFSDANPRWESETILFTKSSLDFLPHEIADKSQNGKPIAVFKQTSGKGQSAGYQLEGWYNIDKLQFLEPKSPELVRMLEQKWSRQDKQGRSYEPQRRAEDWKRSLGYRWAVVKLNIDDTASREKGEPQIERLPDRPSKSSTGNKSVNEMLAELRMENAKPLVDDGEQKAPVAANAEA